jgi:hypothetical protein
MTGQDMLVNRGTRTQDGSSSDAGDMTEDIGLEKSTCHTSWIQVERKLHDGKREPHVGAGATHIRFTHISVHWSDTSILLGHHGF